MTNEHRIETCGNKSFDFAQMLGFTTESVTNSAMKRNVKQLGSLCKAGRLKGVPASASSEQIKEALTVVPGTEEQTEVKAAIEAATKAGNIWYHVIPCFYRVVESVAGERPGAESLAVPGVDTSSAGMF